MREKSTNLESHIRRHGPVSGNLSAYIENGKKPPFEDFKNFLEETIDPEVEKEKTKKIVQDIFERGEISKEDFDIIISSPALRTKQTAKIIKQISGLNEKIRTSELLREVKIPMISQEQYENAENVNEIRELYFKSFLEGNKLDESPIDVYRRAEKFLKYVRKIKNLTEKKPLFMTHWIFMKFLQLAINHNGEELSDEQVSNLIQDEFADTKRFGVVQGRKIAVTNKGTVWAQ